MTLTAKRSESQILSSVLALLKARGIFALRMNVGAMKVKGRYVRFGVAGCADILALPYKGKSAVDDPSGAVIPLWLECKREGGKQSKDQFVFQKMVDAYGHRYFVVTSAEQVNRILENLG